MSTAWALNILDRAGRTGLQVILGYLAAAHTIGGVDWRTAGLAAILAVILSALHGLVDIPDIELLGPFSDVIGRALRTAAQTALGSVAASAILVTDVPWAVVLSATALAAVTSVVTSLIALPIGPEAARGTPAVTTQLS